MSSKGNPSGVRKLLAVLGASAALAAVPAVAAASTWQPGDVFTGVGSGAGSANGAYKIYSNAGTFKETVFSTTPSSETTGCAFNGSNDMFGTHFTAGRIVRFNHIHPHGVQQTINIQTDHPGSGSPESVVFNSSGGFYVGTVNGDNDLLRYNGAGVFQQAYNPAIEARGTDWIDLAKDQKTVFYTSEGRVIRRFNVSGTGSRLADFATLPGAGTAFALRLLPPGDGSGGLLVADRGDIKRLNGAGAVIKTYDAPGEDFWFALNLDPNGTSFWSAGISTRNFYRFNISSGAIERGPINTQTTSSLAGLCVLGEPTAAVPPTPPTSPPSEPTPSPPGGPTTVPGPAADTKRPRIRVAGVRGRGGRCTARNFRARFNLKDSSKLKRVHVRLDGRLVKRTKKKRFSVLIRAKKLRRGRHKITVAARDTAGNRGTRTVRFRRCEPPARIAPTLTG